MFIGFLIGGYLMAVHLKKQLQVLPEIIAIKPVEEKEMEVEAEGEEEKKI